MTIVLHWATAGLVLVLWLIGTFLEALLPEGALRSGIWSAHFDGGFVVAAPVVTVRDLAGEALIAGAPGLFQQSVEAAFAEAATKPRFVHMTQDTGAWCGLVAQGAGLAIIDPIPARELAHLPIVLRMFRRSLPIASVMIRAAGRRGGWRGSSLTS